MTRHKGQFGLRLFPLNPMQIRPTNGAGAHADQDLFGSRLGSEEMG